MIFQLVKQMAKDEGDEAILTCKQLETLEKYDDTMNEKQSHFGSIEATLHIGKSNRFTALPWSWYAPSRNNGNSPYGVWRIP